jgi:hypothetical protein
MLVKLLTQLSFAHGVFAIGDDVDIPDSQAVALLELGLVTRNLATDAPAAATLAPPPEDATLPRATKRGPA